VGAMPWQHEVPWQPDAGAALRALQAEEFRHRYDLSRELDKWRADAEQALQAEQESGDRFGLAAIWAKQLKTIADVKSKPLPQSTQEQIESLRRVLPEGYGGVLDVTAVDEAGGVDVVRPLTPQQVEELFGTTRPTLETVRKSLHGVMAQLDRGESVAFAAYDESGTPTHWVFLGNTVD
jgi:hypothetical protein